MIDLDFDDCLDVLIEQPSSSKKNDLTDFFDGDVEVISDNWEDHWKGMPDFVQEEKKPYKKLNVCFQTKEDFDAFRSLIGQTMTEKTKTIWYPPFDREKNSLFAWIEDATE